MFMAPLRWMGRNLGALLLAFLLALIVWVSAAINADPNQECQEPRVVPLQVIGQDPNLILTEEPPNEIEVLLFAPRSICDRIASEAGAIEASVDISGLEAGEHTLPVNVQISSRYRPMRLLNVTPETVGLTLEAFFSRTLPIRLEVSGEPAPGYRAGLPIVSESRVTVEGRKSLVDRVEEAVATLDITEAQADISRNISIAILDENGNPVTGLTVRPTSIVVRQQIERPSTFRDVTVKVVTIGREAEGYRLTNIAVSPQVVTVFSSDPERIRLMPGFVETIPLDLTDATDDIERRLPLVLPENVFVVGEQSVLVQVSIAAIESSLSLTLDVELIGLPENLAAEIAPETLDVILSGPLPVLQNLQPQDVRAVLDLTGLEPGTHTLEAQVEILPVGVEAESVLPAAVEVEIFVPPTPTPTALLPLTATLTIETASVTSTPFPTPTPSPTPTNRPTFTPTPVATPTPSPTTRP